MYFLYSFTQSEAPNRSWDLGSSTVLHLSVVRLQTIVLLIAVVRPIPRPAVTVLRLGTLADDIVERILNKGHIHMLAFWSWPPTLPCATKALLSLFRC